MVIIVEDKTCYTSVRVRHQVSDDLAWRVAAITGDDSRQLNAKVDVRPYCSNVRVGPAEERLHSIAVTELPHGYPMSSWREKKKRQ